MKTIYTLCICLFFVTSMHAQDRYLTKNGSVTFFSSSPMEDIKADNNQVLSIVDASNGNMAISILMKSFLFKKALMQEHFNENYVESDKYPKALFKGKILNFDAINKTTSKAKVEGTITIHGVAKPITINANINRTADAINMEGEFYVKVADFNIKIPKVVVNNIAKNIKVTFQFNHKPYKK